MLNQLLRCVRRRLRRHPRGEGGQALLFVLAGLALLGTIPIAIATTTVNQLPETTRNLNFEAAYEAGQAGLNDYMQHLDANEAYGLYCNGCTSGTNGNPAFTGWVQASSSPLEYYSYNSSDTDGQISLEVSGKAGTGRTSMVRTFSYDLTPASSLDDVYWSNYETLDNALGYSNCNYYYGQSASYPPSSCIVQFQTGDVLNGPIFSNDTFRMCGSPTFDDTMESGNIYNSNSGASSVYVAASGCGSLSPTFNGSPKYAKVGNETPRSASDDILPARNYGCFITGGSGSSLTQVNVTMSLAVSGSTTKVTWSGSGAGVDNASSNPNNAKVTSPTHANYCTSPITLSNLETGLIFVNGNVTISGQMTGALDVVTCATSSDVTDVCNSTPNSNIVVNGNLTYPSADKTTSGGQPTSDSQDVLGLIAQNFVEVTTTSNEEIDAAILALNDSFYVNNWTSSSYGTLSVFGSIAQNLPRSSGHYRRRGVPQELQLRHLPADGVPALLHPPDGGHVVSDQLRGVRAGLVELCAELAELLSQLRSVAAAASCWSSMVFPPGSRIQICTVPAPCTARS